jgi:hypothetical protein
MILLGHCFTGMRSGHTVKLSQDQKGNILHLSCTLLCIVSTKCLKCKHKWEIVSLHHVLLPNLLSAYKEQIWHTKSPVRVKVDLCVSFYGGVAPFILNLAVGDSEWTALYPSCFITKEQAPSTH